MDLSFWFPWTDFWMTSLFDIKQIVGSDHHFVHLEGGVIFLKSELLLCLDNLMVAAPYSLGTILYSFQLGLRPEAAVTMLQEAWTFYWNLLCSPNGHLPCVWTSETIPRGLFQIRISCVLPWLILVRLITTVVSVVLTVMLSSTPWGNHAIVWCLHCCCGGSPSPCGVLCPLLSSALAVLAWALLPGAIGGVIWLFCWGLMMNPMNECLTGGVLIRGMSNMGRTRRGGVPAQHTGLLVVAEACEPSNSGAVVAAWASPLCYMVVASASLM